MRNFLKNHSIIITVILTILCVVILGIPATFSTIFWLLVGYIPTYLLLNLAYYLLKKNKHL